MGVVNTNSVNAGGGAGPHTITITLNKTSGNNRAVILVASIDDANAANNIATFDPLGINIAMSELIPLTKNSIDTSYIQAWYILDADLPAGSGTFSIDVTHTLVLNNLALGTIYLEDVIQSAPLSATKEDNTTITPFVATPASINDIVIDVWMSDENFGTYSPDAGQTSIYVIDAGTIGFSSHRIGSDNMGWTNDQTATQLHIGGYIILSPIVVSGAGIPILRRRIEGY